MSYNDLRQGRFSALGQEYFITTVVQHRTPIFSDFYLARSYVTCLKTVAFDFGEVLAWVVMPDHVHFLFRLDSGQLSRFMQTLNGYSSRCIQQRRKGRGRLWQPGYFDHALREEESRLAIARYIVANPLRAGLVGKLGEYPHWDSVWLHV